MEKREKHLYLLLEDIKQASQIIIISLLVQVQLMILSEVHVAYQFGLVTLESITVPGRGLPNCPRLSKKNRALILFFTTTQANLGLQGKRSNSEKKIIALHVLIFWYGGKG